MARTTSGTRLKASQIPSSGLNFGGSTSAVVAMNDTADLRPATTNKFTWSAWIYLFSTRNNVLPRIIEKGGIFFCVMGDQTNTRRNQIALEILNSSNSDTTEYWGSTRLTANRWYHVVTVFNDITGQHYVNGVAETMTTLLGPYVSPLHSTSGITFKLGNRASNSRNINGVIARVRMWNRDLSASEVIDVYNWQEPTSGLVASWDVDEGTGSSITDDVNGYNGTITSAVWQSFIKTRTSSGSRSASGTRIAV